MNRPKTEATRTYTYTDWVEYWRQRRFAGNSWMSEPEKPKEKASAVQAHHPQDH